MTRITIPLGFLTALLVGAAAAPSGRAQCQPEWLPGQGAQNVDGEVRCAIPWDSDGSGPEPALLIIGGQFTVAGNALANHIAAWDGTRWSPLATGCNGTVSALAVYDDGSGPALHAAGYFSTAGDVPSNDIAKWDGAQWSALGLGLGGEGGSALHAQASALTVFDDGAGPALYAAGEFTTADGAAANNIARWNGTHWSPLATGCDAAVRALAMYNDGSGPALYAAGDFTSAGGVAANYVARWDGQQWSALGGGPPGPATGLAVFNDGSGPALYVTGQSSAPQGEPINYVAKWDGTSWSTLRTQYITTYSMITTVDEGQGPALYVAGFTDPCCWPDSSPRRYFLTRWDGTSWSDVAWGDMLGKTLAVFDDGGGPALYAGGTDFIAKQDGYNWLPLGYGINGEVHAIAVYDAGSGPALYAGGSFTTIGDATAKHLARWNGTSWAPLPTELDGNVRALAVFDDGGGPALYVLVDYPFANVQYIGHVARWDGNQWSPVGTEPVESDFNAMAVFDDGQGPALFVAGGNLPNVHLHLPDSGFVSKWDGASWSSVAVTDDVVETLLVYDDGGGWALHARGPFSSVNGVALAGAAKWDGTSWSAADAAINGLVKVRALAVYDDGSGPAIYAGGSFDPSNGARVSYIAKWDGSTWLPLDSGLYGSVYALTVFDDGRGPVLYAGGAFASAGGRTSAYVARWWSACSKPVGEPNGVQATMPDQRPAMALCPTATLAFLFLPPLGWLWMSRRRSHPSPRRR